MFVDDFKARYTTIPFATYSRNRRKNTRSSHTETLLHMHREIELFMVLSGEAQVEVDSSVYRLQAGDLAVIAPYTLHRYTLFADRDIHHYCICFDGDLLFDKRMKMDLEQGRWSLSPVIRKDPLCGEYVKKAYLAHAEKREGWEFNAVGNLSLLFARFIERDDLKKRTEVAKPPVYARFYQYICDHFGEEVTSLDAAEAFNLDHSYFCRLFKKSFGEPFQTYLCKFRIEKAKQRLRNTDQSVSQIASETGFNSFSYFSKKFKEYNGMTPKEYRNK